MQSVENRKTETNIDCEERQTDRKLRWKQTQSNERYRDRKRKRETERDRKKNKLKRFKENTLRIRTSKTTINFTRKTDMCCIIRIVFPE